jgi:hypothetical protein
MQGVGHRFFGNHPESHISLFPYTHRFQDRETSSNPGALFSPLGLQYPKPLEQPGLKGGLYSLFASDFHKWPEFCSSILLLSLKDFILRL